jgi:hypothetical protein
MQLVYLSLDELNRSLVRRWGRRNGVQVACASRFDQVPRSVIDGVLLDLDHLPPGRLVMSLVEAPGATYPVAAHGYSGMAVELEQRGVAVHRKLHAGLLRELADAMQRAALNLVVADDLTWINLG